MQRRGFLAATATFLASFLTSNKATLTAHGTADQPPVTGAAQTVDNDYLLVNNWYLKKEDITNT